MAPKIVIAEDDPNILELLKIFLNDRGYDVTCASDGREALEKVGEIKPDLLITDVMMPRMNGYQLVNALCNEQYDIELPKIIILTSRTDPADIRRGLTVGADMYIQKPFDLEEIDSQIKELLEERPKTEDQRPKTL